MCVYSTATLQGWGRGYHQIVGDYQQLQPRAEKIEEQWYGGGERIIYEGSFGVGQAASLLCRYLNSEGQISKGGSVDGNMFYIY